MPKEKTVVKKEVVYTKSLDKGIIVKINNTIYIGTREA